MPHIQAFVKMISSLQISERALDIVMDHLYTLNESTPKIKCIDRTGVDPSFIFGLDTKLFTPNSSHRLDDTHNVNHKNDHDHGHDLDSTHHDEVETATILRLEPPNTITPTLKSSLTREKLEEGLAKLPKSSVYRVKGFLAFAHTPQSPMETFILNWAFSRFELTPFEPSPTPGETLIEGSTIRLTMMGERGEVKTKWARRLADSLGAEVV